MLEKPEYSEAMDGYRLVVGGGGTGGHLFPGIAVAQAFKARRPGNQVLFVNAGRPLEVDVLSRLGGPNDPLPLRASRAGGGGSSSRPLARSPVRSGAPDASFASSGLTWCWVWEAIRPAPW